MKAATSAAAVETVEFFDEVEQRSDEWRRLHIGVPSASNFAAIMAQGDGKMRKKLLNRMAGEMLTDEPAESYSNAYMQRGVEMEETARAQYQWSSGAKVERVGFVKRSIPRLSGTLVIGCSPDSLVDADGVLEIKTMMPELMIEQIDRVTFPPEHKAQVQGSLLVTGRQWCDLVIFYRGMPVTPRFRMFRDEPYIKGMLEDLECFAYDLQQIVARIRKKGAS